MSDLGRHLTGRLDCKDDLREQGERWKARQEDAPVTLMPRVYIVFPEVLGKGELREMCVLV